MRVEIPKVYHDTRVTIDRPDDDPNAVVRRRGRTAKVREDEDGRYAGLGVDDAHTVMDRFEEEFGVSYDRETGEIDRSTDSATETTDGADDENAGDGADSGGDDGARADAEEYADGHWNATKTAVVAGDADHCLDELEDLDTRDAVKEAIETRREQLEG